ncbi:MAG: C4-type zinc ribbon domain-containing protein [Verrucomicrobiales bacterium]|nr:C4-type zinc ribbon domain-containing protein [Verrucomicrobiales bacterium]
MKELLETLVELQALELGEVKIKNAEAKIARLRKKIPAQVLGHYDRLMARGKKGIVPVRNQACTGCHLRVPIAVIMTLVHGKDLQLCDSCGRYLYLPDDARAAFLSKSVQAREQTPGSKSPGNHA